MYLGFIGTLFILHSILMLGCAIQKKERRDNRTIFNQQGAEDINPNTPVVDNTASTVPDTDGYMSSMRWPVFDTKYNFIRDKRLSASDLASRFPVYGSTEVAILNNGNDFLRYRLDLIDGARSTIDIQTYVIHGDESGVLFVDKLISAHKRGVKIRIIIDPVSNLELKSQSLLSKLKSSGILLEGWEPLYLYAFSMYKPNIGLQEFLDEGNQRQHDKIFIVDAKTSNAAAIAGGSNIGNQYFRIRGKDPLAVWSDKDIAVKGNIINNMSAEFQKNLDRIKAFKENKAILNLDPLWNFINLTKNILKKNPGSIINDFKLDTTMRRQFEDIDKEQQNLKWLQGKARYFTNHPRENETIIYHSYLNFIQNSRKEILILNSYFLPTESIRNALGDALKRGVRIKIITNSPEVNDNPAVSHAGRILYKDLLGRNSGATGEGKLEIYEWGGEPLLKNGEGLNHSKYAVFDREAGIVGSFNLDPRSINLNSENVVCFEDPNAAAELGAQFDEAVSQKYSILITPDRAKALSDPSDSFGQIKNKFLDSLIPML